MLPGLRFLFAAILMCSSLLVFGMGAIALLRASHQQFASGAPSPPPEPVFAQAPQTVPALSMLKVDPPQAPPLADVASSPAPDRTASLTSAERSPEPSAPPVTGAETRPAEPATDTRSGAATQPAEPPPMPPVTPFAEQPTANAPVAIAEAPVAKDQEKAPAPEAPQSAPAVQPAQTAAAPETAAPAATGSIAMPEDQPVGQTTEAISDQPAMAAPVGVEAPLPQPRPVAALPPEAPRLHTPKVAAKPAIKRKVRHARRHRPKSEKLPAVTSAPTLGSLFGGTATK